MTKLRDNGWLPFVLIFGTATLAYSIVVWLSRSQANDNE